MKMLKVSFWERGIKNIVVVYQFDFAGVELALQASTWRPRRRLKVFALARRLQVLEDVGIIQRYAVKPRPLFVMAT
jgi:hypothetical protein